MHSEFKLSFNTDIVFLLSWPPYIKIDFHFVCDYDIIQCLVPLKLPSLSRSLGWMPTRMEPLHTHQHQGYQFHFHHNKSLPQNMQINYRNWFHLSTMGPWEVYQNLQISLFRCFWYGIHLNPMLVVTGDKEKDFKSRRHGKQ